MPTLNKVPTRIDSLRLAAINAIVMLSEIVPDKNKQARCRDAMLALGCELKIDEKDEWWYHWQGGTWEP